VGIHDDFADYYYFLQPLGGKASEFAARLLTLLLRKRAPAPGLTEVIA
jgi:hypothetical protein